MNTNELLNQICKEIKKIKLVDKNSNKILFGSKNYVSLPITSTNFKKIPDKINQDALLFVDGGNFELISSPNFSIQLIRLCANLYKNNERISTQRFEFFCLINSESVGDKINYKVHIFSQEKESKIHFKFLDGYLINSTHESIVAAGKRADIRSVVDVCRRLAEINFAKQVVENLNVDLGFVILDGVLETKYPIEKDLMDELVFVANSKNFRVCSLAKSSNLFTDKAEPAVSFLNSKAQSDIWYCKNLVQINCENHLAEIMFVKLNLHANYVFRFELGKTSLVEQIPLEKIEKVIWLLKENSCDPVFLGYPYGLIEVDRFARVSETEVSSLKTILISRLSSDKELVTGLNAFNAHSILDNIS